MELPRSTGPVPVDALEVLDGCPRRFQLRFLEGHREPRAGTGGEGLSPRHRDGRLEAIRSLVAALAPEAWGAGLPDEVLGAAAGRAGLTLSEAEALDLLRPLRRLGRALRTFTAGFSWSTAVPFHVRLGEASVEGRFDLLLSGAPGEAALRLVAGAREGRATVAVLLAALRERAGEGREVRAAAFPVDGDEETIRWRSEPSVAPSALEAGLVSALALGSALAPALDRPACEALGCGFVARCHSSGRGL